MSAIASRGLSRSGDGEPGPRFLTVCALLCLGCSRHLPAPQPLRELRERVPAALRRHPPQERLQPLLRGGLPVRRGLRAQRQELHPAAQLRLLRRRQILRGGPRPRLRARPDLPPVRGPAAGG